MFTVRAKPKSGSDLVTLVRPSELPVYDEPSASDRFEYQQQPAGVLEESVRDLRRDISDFFWQYKDTSDYVEHLYSTAKAHSAGALASLQDETNLVARASVVTAGGLAGLLVAALRRRGLVKRLLYTGVGLAVPTAICYPSQTKVYSRWGLEESKRYSVIAYNFMVGAKPNSEPTPAPKQTSPVEKPVPVLEKSASAPEPAAPSRAAEAPAPVVPRAVAAVVDDPGQSNPEDADLYTTRG